MDPLNPTHLFVLTSHQDYSVNMNGNVMFSIGTDLGREPIVVTADHEHYTATFTISKTM